MIAHYSVACWKRDFHCQFVLVVMLFGSTPEKSQMELTVEQVDRDEGLLMSRFSPTDDGILFRAKLLLPLLIWWCDVAVVFVCRSSLFPTIIVKMRYSRCRLSSMRFSTKHILLGKVRGMAVVTPTNRIKFSIDICIIATPSWLYRFSSSSTREAGDVPVDMITSIIWAFRSDDVSNNERDLEKRFCWCCFCRCSAFSATRILLLRLRELFSHW